MNYKNYNVNVSMAEKAIDEIYLDDNLTNEERKRHLEDLKAHIEQYLESLQ